ncbi:MAG: phosphatidate cytidylyltransferase [Actinobacteria bacterium HGW-Actinobacteria-9]|nr:MAG: phosphatidate cytidylyltransferase [Actinobacteria bacterium HGW-Actinobacteria-9]
MAREVASEGFTKFFVRLFTAFVYAVVMLGAIVFGRTLGLGIVLAIAALFAVSELYAFTRREHRMPNELFGLAATAAMPIATGLWGYQGLMGTLAALLVASMLWHVAFRQVRTSDTAVTVFGAVYVGFLLSHLVLIRALDSGTELALATIIGVWANDVFAYLVGSTMGRHKMAPRISPHKSWEGFAAGTAFTVMVWVAVGYVADTGLSIPALTLTGLAVSFAAVLGDLAESRLKREAGVKDSGRLLPGHGGFLDRFDSMILVSVVAYYLLIIGGAR